MTRHHLLLALACSVGVVAPAHAQTVLGPQRTAVVLLNWQDVQTQPTTVSRAISDMTSVRAWYQRASYGAMDLPFDVYGWVTAPVNAAGQCMTGLADDYGTPLVVAQIGQAKWDTYAKRLWVLPTTAAPGVRCYPNAALCGKDAVVYDNVGPALHELGHTFCLPHVDARDKMNPGAGPWSFGPLAKTRLGWLDRTGQPSTRLVTTGGVYAIEGYETAARGVKALRVRAKTGGLFGTLEYWVKSINAGEVAVQLGGNDVKLSGSDVVLDVGQSWTSPEGITLRTEAASTSGASIRVAYAGETPAAQPPPQGLTSAQFVGTSAEDSVRDVETDAAGDIHATGGTAGALFGLSHAGVHDMWYARWNSAGQLQCALLYGGPNYDRAYALTLLPDGDAVIAGRAGVGFPTTAGVAQPAFGGDTAPEAAYGPQDGALVRIRTSDCTVVWASYAGGPDKAIIRDVSSSAQGIYAVFSTTTSPMPHVPTDAWDATLACGDAVLLRVALDGTSADGTYIGGSHCQDGGNPSVATGPLGVYALVGMPSADGPVSSGAAQMTLGGGLRDVMLCRFAFDLRTRDYCTFIGGTGNEGMETHHLAVLSDGAAVVSVYTTGGWPGGGCVGAVDFGIAVVNASGTAFEGRRCLGTTMGDPPEGVAVDEYDRIILTGYTSGTPWGGAASGGTDGVLTLLSRDLATRIADVRIGGAGDDQIRAVWRAPGGVVVGGTTVSGSFPASGAYGGGMDGWWGHVALPPPAAPSPCVVNPLALTVIVTGSHPIIGWTGSVTATDERGCQATETH